MLMTQLATAIMWAGALMLSSCVQTEEESKPSHDHVLFIVIDDLNDWVGCLSDPADPTDNSGYLTRRGHPQASTPHFDRLSERGVLFTNAHCQAPICRPSRHSLFSGLRPSTTGIYGNVQQHDAEGSLKAGKDVPWLTRRFEAAGYQVYTAGKLLHVSGNRPLGGTRCFDTNQGPYPPRKLGVPSHITPAQVWDFGAYPETMEEYTDWRIAKWTLDHIQRPIAQDEAPRFFALGFYNPHVPLFAPQSFFDAAPKLEDVLLAAHREGDMNDLPEIAKRISSRMSYRKVVNWFLEDQDRLRQLTQAYLACTSAMDDCLGKVVDAVDRSDMADHTWIVICSDHGWHLGEKDHITKQTLWTRSTRVPMVIVPPRRLKDLPRGVRCLQPVELLDVYPTLISAIGLKPADTDQYLEGLSLLPWLRDPAMSRDRPAMTTIYSHNHSFCDDRYRYIRYADGSEELYDRQIDPHEFDNLIPLLDQRPELQSIIDRLSKWIPKQQAGSPDHLLDK